jgi:hypothetical protein
MSEPSKNEGNEAEVDDLPEVVKDDLGRDVYATESKYCQYDYETITESDVVEAVFGEKPFFIGTCSILEQDDDGDKPSPFAAAVENAEDQLEKHLLLYGIELETIPPNVDKLLQKMRKKDKDLGEEFPAVSGHRRGPLPERIAKRTGRPMYYYCKRCLELRGFKSGNPTEVCAAVVVGARLTEGPACAAGEETKATLTVEKLFPHDVACGKLPFKDTIRPGIYLNQHGGGGSLMVARFPYETIVGDTMDQLLEEATETDPSEGNLLYGKAIYPQTYERGKLDKTEYPFDNRRFHPIPSPDENVIEALAPKKVRQMLIRQWYYIANNFSLSSEMHDMQFKEIKTVGSKYKMYPTWPRPEKKPVPHLRIVGAALLWGGHKRGDDLEAVDQLIHEDIPDIMVADSKEDGEEYYFGVTDNPELQERGHFRPGTVIIPIQDERLLCVISGGEKRVATVKKGEMVFFTGDFAHAGKTYDEEDPSWHFSIHFYIDSIYHKYNPYELGVPAVANCVFSAPHCRYLQDTFVKNIKEVGVTAIEELEAAVKNHVLLVDDAIRGSAPKKKRNRRTRDTDAYTDH